MKTLFDVIQMDGSDDNGRKNHKVHFTSTTDEWATPQWLFDYFSTEFDFTLDVCSTDENAKCPRHFTRKDDGLSTNWVNETIWMNPPYGRTIGKWVRKAWESSLQGATVVCLLPSRTDTKWWHQYCMKGEIRFIKGRLKFGDSKNSAPFPSAIVIFRPPFHVIKSVDVAEMKAVA